MVSPAVGGVSPIEICARSIRLLERSQWEAVLREAGFCETASLPGLIGPTGGEGQIGVLARKAWRESLRQSSAELEALMESPEEIVAYFRGRLRGLGDRLASRLRATGARCRVAHRGSDFAPAGMDAFTLRAEAPEDWKQLLEECAGDAPPQRLVYLWTLDEPWQKASPALMGTDALLHLTQAIELTRPAAKLRIDLVTRGAQPAGRKMNATAVAQAPAIGLLRVMLSEHSNFACRGIDLSPRSFGIGRRLALERIAAERFGARDRLPR